MADVKSGQSTDSNKKYSIADYFTLGSLGMFVTYLSARCSLKTINSSAIWSVDCRRGIKAELGRKRRTRARIRGNISELETLLEENDLTRREEAVINSMLGNYRFYIDVLNDQLDRLEDLSAYEQLSLFYEDLREDTNEIPF